MNAPLSILIPGVPDEKDCGIRFTLDSQYGIIVIFADELRPNAHKDTTTERFMHLLIQTQVVMLKHFGKDRYEIAGPPWAVDELMRRARETLYLNQAPVAPPVSKGRGIGT